MFYYSIISGPVKTGGFLRFMLDRNQDNLQEPTRLVAACQEDLTQHESLRLRSMMAAIDVYLSDHAMPYEYASSGDCGDYIELVLIDHPH